MIRPTAASSPTTDPLDALLPQASTTSPLHDMAEALHGRLGLALAVAAVATVALFVHRSVRARRRDRWARGVMVSHTASRNFALYRMAGASPGGDVRALTPSWPAGSTVADQPCAFPAPDASDLRTAPWATWIQTQR